MRLTDRAGKRDMIHKNYLENHKKVLFNSLLMQGKLYQPCAEIEEQAINMFDTLIKQMKATEGVTEELKEHDQWDWVQKMSNIEQIAKEIVINEIIYK